MSEYFNVAKTYALISHLVVGLITTILSYFVPVENPQFFLSFGIVWIAGYGCLYFVKKIKRFPRYVFCVAYDVFYLIMATSIGLLFDSDVLFYGLCVLAGVLAFLYFDKKVTTILLIAELVCVSVYSVAVVKPSIWGIIGFVVFFVISWWLLGIYLDIYAKQMEIGKNHRQSLDDMLQLVDEKYEEASQATKAKSLFLANMSHEIRTPINAILGFNTMILRESKEESIKAYAYDIEGSGKSLLSLINDILDMSKIESGKMELVLERYSLSSLLNDVINMISIKAEDKGLSLVVDVDESLPAELIGDDVRIRQVLVNVLNNAVKYTQEGKVTLRVTEERKDSHSLLCFTVEDTGVGIKEEDMGKLFENFSRIENERNHQIEGTGLGMNITTNLLALMNSKLEVESVYGEGSTFRFVIDQEIVDAAPIGNLQKRIKESKVHYSYKERFKAPSAKILVVDDNMVNRRVFKGLLKPLQMQIDEADSGKQALAMTIEKQYDLIFLDHMMPEMDGIETLQRMREQEEGLNRDTYVIALTANAISGAKEIYLSAGFQNYLSKPIEPVKLEELLDRVLPDKLKEYMDQPEEESVVDTESVEETIEFPLIEGVDWANARLHIPDDEAILDVVKSFYYTIDDEADYLETMFNRLVASQLDEEALNLYRVKVHAMKSTSYLFGAFPIAGLAATLEYAARDEELDYILSTTPFFLARWRAYKEKLKPLVASDDSAKKEIANPAEIAEKLDRLYKAVESFDMHAGDAIMEDLQSYDFSGELAEDIEKLASAVMNFDAERVKLIGEEIVRKL